MKSTAFIVAPLLVLASTWQFVALACESNAPRHARRANARRDHYRFRTVGPAPECGG